MAPVRPASVTRPTQAPPDPLFCPRPVIERQIVDAIAARANLVLYGPARQGKTTLLARHLDEAGAIHIDCRPKLSRSQIYRFTLSSLGYSVMVSSKRKGKASATVKMSLFGAGLDASADAEAELVMESVNIDLKNASEVAHLIARMGQPLYLVLNNFQLLDEATREDLLFDLVCFTERSQVRFIVIGEWEGDDYLEEIAPASAGRLECVNVPMWSADELGVLFEKAQRHAAAGAPAPRLDQLLSMAAGDVALFRTMLGNARTRPPDDGAAGEQLVAARFARGMATRMKALLDQRDAYVGYESLTIAPAFTKNPRFDPDAPPAAGEPASSTINAATGQRFSDGRSVRLDEDGNPEFLECLAGSIVACQVELACFIVRQLHAAAQQGSSALAFDDLGRELLNMLDPAPLDIDPAKATRVFAQILEAQRRALVTPAMFAVNGRQLCIADRRFFLYLHRTSSEDLEDLLEESLPEKVPRPKRHSMLSRHMDKPEKRAYVDQALQRAKADLAGAADALAAPA
ncbi:MAG: ATP-binding protein, partial [Pseudomonadota bacterium]|nr:ATP-binding protein [Pseudomonadota bacterium]